MSSPYVQTAVTTHTPTALPPPWAPEGAAAAPRPLQTGVGVSRRPACLGLYLTQKPGEPRRAGRSVLDRRAPGAGSTASARARVPVTTPLLERVSSPLRPSWARIPAFRMPLQVWGSFFWEVWGLGPGPALTGLPHTPARKL